MPNQDVKGFSTMSSSMPDAVNYHGWLSSLVKNCANGSSLLEVGPGYGQYTIEWAQSFSRVVAADIDQECVEHLERELPEVESLVADLSHSEWVESVTRQGLFDNVVALNVLEHIEDDTSALRSMHAALNDGGRAILLVPAHQKLYGTMDSLAGHHRRYSKRDLSDKMSDAGFRVRTCRYLNPIGGVGWWVNAVLLKPQDLSGAGVNRQILFFDRWLVHLSKLVSPLMGCVFGQSLWCCGEKIE